MLSIKSNYGSQLLLNDRNKLVLGGKSGQDRARWWLTATRGDPRDSATENTQPILSPLVGSGGNGEMVR
jgi:hypothetical protein